MFEDDDHKLQIWHRAIETQMHFAELSIKMRQIGLTLVGATLALALYIFRSKLSFSILIPWTDEIVIPVASVLCIGAAIILGSVWLVDVGVYHQMLRGAVRFNELYEKELDDQAGWKSGLTETISAYSRYKNPVLLGNRGEDGKVWIPDKKYRSAMNKINWFYGITSLTMFAAGISMALVENFGAIIYYE